MIDRPIKSHCNSCGKETNQFILHEQKRERHEEDFHWTDTYMILQCCGCDRVSMRQDYETPNLTDDNGNDLHEIHHYPPAIFRRPPNWNHGGFLNRFEFEEGLKGRFLEEIYVCLQNKCERAAVMLIRALLEHIFIEKVGDKGTFGGNLDEFEKQGFIAKVDRNSIRDVLEAGHAAMHRGFVPSSSDLMTIMDIVESLIERLFVHPKQTKKLKENIPRRRKRRK